MNNERKAFNQWVLTHPDNLDLTAYEENIMFDAWQASTQRQGYKLVPVDTLKNIINPETYDDGFIAICEIQAMIGAVNEK